MCVCTVYVFGRRGQLEHSFVISETGLSGCTQAYFKNLTLPSSPVYPVAIISYPADLLGVDANPLETNTAVPGSVLLVASAFGCRCACTMSPELSSVMVKTPLLEEDVILPLNTAYV